MNFFNPTPADLAALDMATDDQLLDLALFVCAFGYCAPAIWQRVAPVLVARGYTLVEATYTPLQLPINPEPLS